MGAAMSLEGESVEAGSKTTRPEVPSAPQVKIWKVSRVGAQGVTSKSKLLAREMPLVCSRGLRVDSKRKGLRGGAGSKKAELAKKDAEEMGK